MQEILIIDMMKRKPFRLARIYFQPQGLFTWSLDSLKPFCIVSSDLLLLRVTLTVVLNSVSLECFGIVSGSNKTSEFLISKFLKNTLNWILVEESPLWNHGLERIKPVPFSIGHSEFVHKLSRRTLHFYSCALFCNDSTDSGFEFSMSCGFTSCHRNPRNHQDVYDVSHTFWSLYRDFLWHSQPVLFHIHFNGNQWCFLWNNCGVFTTNINHNKRSFNGVVDNWSILSHNLHTALSEADDT